MSYPDDNPDLSDPSDSASAPGRDEIDPGNVDVPMSPQPQGDSQSGQPEALIGAETMDFDRALPDLDAALPDLSGATDDRGTRRKRTLPFWIEVPLLMALALVIAVVIKTFLIQAFFIPSGSMEDTLAVDDRILVNKLSYRFGDPARGDVVVFDSGTRRDESFLESVRRNLAEAVGLSAPESDFIKRIVGLPGEEISIVDNEVFIDGEALDEPYLRPGTDMRDFGPEEIPAGHYFMMGDHRNLSSDSRVSGPVHIDRFVGRAFVIVWPPGNWDGL